MQTIVIAGGGAGGLELATRLGDRLGRRRRARIVLIDRSPTHVWKPLLHEVASGKLDPQVHQVEYSAQAAHHHFEFVHGEVMSVDRTAQAIDIGACHGGDGSEHQPGRKLHYDKLVLAFGAVTNFFGIAGAAEHSMTLDSVDQAEQFRQRLVALCVQKGIRRETGIEPDAKVNVVIVGAGATGVELAAELHHTAHALAKYNIHALDPARDVRIRIVERGDRILPQLDAKLARNAEQYLRSLGIEVCTASGVAKVTSDAVHDEAGNVHASDITLWAAGVEGPQVCATLGLRLNRLRQVLVGPSLQTVDDPKVFAIGDCSSHVCSVNGTVIPPRAQAAHQQAVFLATVLGESDEKCLPHFQYRDYGSLVSLGPFVAVGVLIGRLGKFGSRGVVVDGMLARVLYRLMYRKHVLVLHGFVSMVAQTLSHWLRGRLAPPVKLH
ncbi:NAD(P)/FAD-dependent oxidoreductase [Noviherbaspirillum sp.]|uniref:NAD(P)/FAD-dependent oxidoreductase n=1 Tax=Noviherbaspirillum sp. TaxID=1926288 RepID=UPI002FDF1B7F